MSTDSTAVADSDWLTLDDGEEVVWSSVPHEYSLVPAFAIGIPLSLVLVGIPIVVSAWLWRKNTVYVITTQALYAKSGVLSRDVQRIDFGKVQNITYTQGLFGTQFGYGNVDVSTAGSSGVEMRFTSVPDPKAVADRIKARVRDDGGEPDEEKGAVLDDILAELRAIRRAVEGESPTTGPNDSAAAGTTAGSGQGGESNPPER
jgi:uncharacterized membrane protein YdbT with pleckstrin-like domain